MSSKTCFFHSLKSVLHFEAKPVFFVGHTFLWAKTTDIFCLLQKTRKPFWTWPFFYTYTLFILILCSCAERLSILPPVHNISILSSLFYSSFLHSAFSSFPSISAHRKLMIYHSIHTQINKYYTLLFSILILLSKKSYT